MKGFTYIDIHSDNFRYTNIVRSILTRIIVFICLGAMHCVYSWLSLLFQQKVFRLDANQFQGRCQHGTRRTLVFRTRCLTGMYTNVTRPHTDTFAASHSVTLRRSNPAFSLQYTAVPSLRNQDCPSALYNLCLCYARQCSRIGTATCRWCLSTQGAS